VAHINQQHQTQPTEPIQYSIQSLLLVAVKAPMPIVKLAGLVVVAVVGQIQLALVAPVPQVKAQLAALLHHLLTIVLLAVVVLAEPAVLALIQVVTVALEFNQVLAELPHIMAVAVAAHDILMTVLLAQAGLGAAVPVL
jgi:hypothetical protein